MTLLAISLLFCACVVGFVLVTNRLPRHISIPLMLVALSLLACSAFAMTKERNLNTGFFLLTVTGMTTAVIWLIHFHAARITAAARYVYDMVFLAWFGPTVLLWLVLLVICYVKPLLRPLWAVLIVFYY